MPVVKRFNEKRDSERKAFLLEGRQYYGEAGSVD